MSDVASTAESDTASVVGDGGAGALLRAARQQQGVHLAMLAATIKVAPSKLEALEAGRYQDLPDPTFTRALAQSMCRALKIDAAPVLARLPSSAGTVRLENVDRGLNAPFRDRPGRVAPADWRAARHPVVWLVAGLLIAAAALWWWPEGWTARWTAAPVPDARPTAAEPPAATASALLPAVTADPTPPQIPAATQAAAPVAAPSTPPLAATVAAGGTAGAGLRAVETSWVQLVDADGKVLVSRLLAAGEALTLDGAVPLKVRIGNARGTELTWRGQRVDLAPATRDNVAQLELK